MATRWTAEQNSAIVSKNQNLLLSAAAGSGKTAVLVERIISRITDENDPMDADRLLVVTFTNAAANEMRDRIIGALEKRIEQDPKNKFYARQLTLVKSAKITTIDSFCIDVLRKYFVEADLSPDFGIADPTECKVLLEEALDNVINEMYDDEKFGTDFLELMESYTNSKANDINFRELLISIYYFSQSLPYPDEWLDASSKKFNISGSFDESEYKDIIIREAHDELERIVSEYNIMTELAEKDGMEDLIGLLITEKSFFEECLNISDYMALKEKIDAFSFERKKRAPKDATPLYLDDINEMRDKIKQRRVGKLREKILNLTSVQQENAIKKMYPLMVCLSETVKRLAREFLSMKLEKNTLDFSDCEHRCLDILTKDGEPTEIAEILRNSFDEIYIDEYQDTSKLQESIFSAIKSERNLFMVGDIKQSIYRFRNTDPILFKTKRDNFSKEDEALNRKIILSKNFRSRENILDSVNCIFERIMSEESGEIDYNDDEKLYLGADYPDTAHNPIDSKTEIAIIDTKAIEEENDDFKKTELEAIYCAKRIAELIESSVEIFDKGEYRKITYSDICIIARNVKDNAIILNAVFSEFGIPCYAESTGGYFESREIELMMAMLSVIDNPRQDLPLLSVLRSIMFNITSDELAKIRCYDKRGCFYDAIEKCAATDTPEGNLSREIIATIENFAEKSRQMSVSELILEIYNKTGFYDAQQTMTNGTVRRANLRLLYNRAKVYENTGLRGLYSFIKFINDYKNTGNDLESAKQISEYNDAVRIMSIHKSKGLEFPVVILFAAEHNFNLQDLHRSVLYHAEKGYGPKFVDTDLRLTYTFAPRATLESSLYRESIAEEMRILYVALTRAKEKLIIIGADKNLKKKIRSALPGDFDFRIGASLVAEHTSYLDWIIMAITDHPDGEALRLYIEDDREYHRYEHNAKFDVKILSSIGDLYSVGTDGEIKKSEEKNFDKVLSLLEFEYPNIDDTQLPTKVTVSELKKRKEDERLSDGVELFKRRTEFSENRQGMTASEIGVAYHTVLQKYDLTKPPETKEDVKAMVEEIREKGFLTEEEAGAVNPEKIFKFFKSGTGRMMLSAKEVKREVMFCVSIPAKNFITTTNSDKEIMLQGVIDCLLVTDEGLVVIDYKTDKNFDPNDTVEKYRIQLDCYQYAAEKIFKKPVLSRILFMLDSGTGMSL